MPDIARELQLWGRPVELIVQGKSPRGGAPLSACAEGFTLLYPRDLPDDLTARQLRPDPLISEAGKKLAHARVMFEEVRDFVTAVVEVEEVQKRLGAIAKPGKQAAWLLCECQRLSKQISREQTDQAMKEFQRRYETLSVQVDAACRYRISRRSKRSSPG